MTASIEQATTATIYRNYHGGYFKTLISPEQSNGAFALIDMVLPKGSEPPMHVHTNEDETFYMLEGSIRFIIGGTETILNPGEALIAPRNIPHQFNILGSQARFLTLINPGGLWNYFMEFSSPCEGEPAVVPMAPPPPEQIEYLLHVLATKYQMKFL